MQFDQLKNVKVEIANGIGWVTLNRPDKRNAMSPDLHFEMVDVLKELAEEPAVRVLVLTGAGDSWCAGQDIGLFFRALDDKPKQRHLARLANHEWRWTLLSSFPKPTIAMVNGHCYGGAFVQLFACDFAIAADEAQFGLSEVNWGILPGGLVGKVIVDGLAYRDAVYYAMTGDPFNGKTAAQMRLVTESVPLDRLRARTEELAASLARKNPQTLRTIKESLRLVRGMSVDQAADYLLAKEREMRFMDTEGGREQAMTQFLDDKTYRPGFGEYRRAAQ
ncbi:p-hydroxycinnamoyl CoA hydratase/lyase [Pigmentiphaga sp.]|uniref:p-hydroxycinnamoyl CoA hydratase/lyase n=1 Tax=Pigmentiphaga sp. TaxID=1977564 RepID=UPI00128CE2EA|nr:p-hydroxycinnamoyl CoA hydratase/lyase [Pigmentiphaga sp.]MPS26887.1 p-hydroxycinnamoyl CoA hydratase/lyase [Alcaligenaceae bacterium SAGV5]MPS51987.1 p-hydroxycinnamoyl CoA hydratase/lyase [Alcaligenaceae bacterium SAGV3]MPT60554.1 p-hydroxycinnamoyl CoA hydratase/lyase [Alcaligenaceae bacterium]